MSAVQPPGYSPRLLPAEAPPVGVEHPMIIALLASKAKIQRECRVNTMGFLSFI
jgi:hypothetical protein